MVPSLTFLHYIDSHLCIHFKQHFDWRNRRLSNGKWPANRMKSAMNLEREYWKMFLGPTNFNFFYFFSSLGCQSDCFSIMKMCFSMQLKSMLPAECYWELSWRHWNWSKNKNLKKITKKSQDVHINSNHAMVLVTLLCCNFFFLLSFRHVYSMFFFHGRDL